jgi:hypothetical protein
MFNMSCHLPKPFSHGENDTETDSIGVIWIHERSPRNFVLSVTNIKSTQRMEWKIAITRKHTPQVIPGAGQFIFSISIWYLNILYDNNIPILSNYYVIISICLLSRLSVEICQGTVSTRWLRVGRVSVVDASLMFRQHSHISQRVRQISNEKSESSTAVDSFICGRLLQPC